MLLQRIEGDDLCVICQCSHLACHHGIQYKEGQSIDDYWNFTTDGQYFFSFNPKNKKWAVIHDNPIGIIDKLENNTELAKHLAMLSIGDSGCFLKKFLPYWMKMPSKQLGGLSQENIHMVGKTWKFS